MKWVKAFIAFSCVAVLWLLFQLVLFHECFSNVNDVPSRLLCHEEKASLLYLASEYSRKQPECARIFDELRSELLEQGLPKIFIITPTYQRPVQKAELTRLSHTLLLVPHIHWIIVEDSINKTALVTNFLARYRIPSTHLNVATPEPLKTTVDDPNWLKPRGVLQRNRALMWIRDHLSMNQKGVVYFADDDNTYDLQLFEEMRYTKKVSVWPVGLVGGLMVEKPIIRNGKVKGWNTLWKTNRPFPIDMAGFAVNLTLLLQNKKAAFSADVPRGYQESNLLKDLVTIDELEPKADNCTKVLVWHTRTERPKLKQEKKLVKPSNDGIEI